MKHRMQRFPQLRQFIALSLIILTGGMGITTQQSNDIRTFPETGHTIRGEFRTFWETNHGIEYFGYPQTEEFQSVLADKQTHNVQYFERQRFELHPENQQPYRILLGRIGVEALAAQGRDWQNF